MVDPVEIEIPIYEDVVESKISKYYDFDDNGEIIERTREEETKTTIQTGTQTITKQKINVNKENVYSFAYDLVKKEFGKIFGDENIIDE
jgi:cobyrinic acid a,c-diamide synthase